MLVTDKLDKIAFNVSKILKGLTLRDNILFHVFVSLEKPREVQVRVFPLVSVKKPIIELNLWDYNLPIWKFRVDKGPSEDSVLLSLHDPLAQGVLQQKVVSADLDTITGMVYLMSEITSFIISDKSSSLMGELNRISGCVV